MYLIDLIYHQGGDAQHARHGQHGQCARAREPALAQGVAELPEAAALAIANKRVANILAKQGADGSTVLAQQLLREPAELELAQALERGMQDSAPMLENGDYAGVLRVLAQLRTPIDDFFEQVLVACEDDALRLNRLALLGQLRNAFLAVADISLLAVST